MIELPALEDLPIETDVQSAGWAQRLAVAMGGERTPDSFDLDLIERIVQAIRNEAMREVCERVTLLTFTEVAQSWRKP